MPLRSRVKTLSDKDRENFKLKMITGQGAWGDNFQCQGARDEQQLLKTVAARQEKELERWFFIRQCDCWLTFSKFFEIIFIELKIHHRWGASSDPVRPQWGAGSSQDQDEEGFLKRTDSWCRMMWIKCSCQCFSKKLWVHFENINVQCFMSKDSFLTTSLLSMFQVQEENRRINNLVKDKDAQVYC